MFSKFFIERPIFASVISLVIIIAGGVAMYNLPIAQYPDITPPCITVSTTYPGASADVISQNVAAPIELQVNGVDNMIYMQSASSGTGNMNLMVFFDIGTNQQAWQKRNPSRGNFLKKSPKSLRTFY